MPMITFYPLNEDNLCALPSYLAKTQSHFCDLTLGNIFMWRNELETFFAVRNDTLIVRKETEKGHYCYLFPMGLDIEGALEAMEEYALNHHERLCFYSLNEEQVAFLRQRYPHHQVLSLRSWADYLYNLSDLRDFPGKAYSSKRHNANRFHVQNPDAVFKIATKDDLPRLEAFLKVYLEENKERDISLEEIALTREMIRRPGCIHANIGYYEKNGEIIGFSLSENKGDCLYNHIEKALRSYDGIYQALTSDCLKAFGGDCRYTNREEDDGNEGLRSAKLQLRPVELLLKFYFEVNNPIDLVKDFERLEGEKVSLSLVEESEKNDYASLALDEENNRYWGYDYHSDLQEGEIADGDYFFNVVDHDNKTRKFLSFAIHNKSGAFVGEITLYAFNSLGGAEVGIRLSKKEQGKGYAKEALALIKGFAKNIGLAYLDYESYQENTPSLALAEKMGFQPLREDHERRYYRLNLLESRLS
jgi:RimJ/RimL family protein N-acetyltransferase